MEGSARPSFFSFDTKSLTLTNVSREKLKFQLSLEESFLTVHPSVIFIDPNDLFHIQIQPSIPNECNLFLRVEGSFGDCEYRYKIQRKNQSKLTFKPSFIGFFRFSPPQEAEIMVAGEQHVDFLGPDWIENDPNFVVGTPMKIICSSLPSDLSFSSLIFNHGKSFLPLVAYKGSASVYCADPVLMVYSNGAFRGSVQVVNSGVKNGFAIFSSEDEEFQNLFISPTAAVVPPSGQVIFKFQYCCSPGEKINLRLTLFSGDEIVRQIEGFLRPASFFSTIFRGIEVPDEISSFSSLLKNVKRKDFKPYFDATLSSQPINLNSDSRTKFIRVSHEILEFRDNNPKIITIFNLTGTSSFFKLSGSDPSIIINPLSGKLAPTLSEIIKVQFFGTRPGSIEIQTQDEIIKIAVIRVESPESISEKIIIQNNSLDFGTIHVNERKKMFIQIRSREEGVRTIPIHLLKSASDVFEFPHSIELKPFLITEMPVIFKPKKPGKCDDTIILDYNGETHQIELNGFASRGE